MIKKNIAIGLSAILVFSTWLVGCTPTGSEQGAKEKEVIKIGVFEPMTGANAAGGQMELEGIKLANELYPEVAGRKIEIVVADNKSDKIEATNAVKLLVDQEKVSAIIGSWGSSYSIAAGPIIQQAKIPAVGATCTNPLVTMGNMYYSRVCFIDPFQGNVMANYAYSELKAKKAAVIKEISSDYSVGLSKYFVESFTKLTGDPKAIVGEANYNTGDQDFNAQLVNIRQLNPDVIFAPGNYTESALLIKQARELGITTPIIGGDSWETPEFLEIGGKAVEGSVFSTFFTNEVPITKESEKFMAEYKKRFNKEPSSTTALAYDSYIMILDAIKRSNSSNPVEINKYLRQTKDFEGAAGIITLDSNGDAIKNAIIKQVKDGQFKYLTTVQPVK